LRPTRRTNARRSRSPSTGSRTRSRGRVRPARGHDTLVVPMSGESRRCPLCDAPTDEAICQVHSVPTLDPAIFDRPPETVDVGKEIGGRYRIERVLAKGAMGSIFVARSVGVQRVVAIKVLHAEKLKDPIALKRFYREALAASSLNHPNIVQLFDFGIDP